MGSSVASIGDKGFGTCTCHESPIPSVGTIIKGSQNVMINGKSCARVSDKIVSGCGHVSTIIKGASKTLANGLSVSRLGDKFASGCYTGTIIKGSSNVIAG